MQGDSREFRVHIPLLWYIAFGVVLYIWVTIAALSVENALSHARLLREVGARFSEEQVRIFSGELRSMIYLVGFLIGLVLFLAWLPLQLFIAARRVSVLIDDQQITLVDWRRRQERIPWKDITEIRVRRYGGLHTTPSITVNAGVRRVTIHPFLRDRRVLLEELLARAGLPRTSSNWIGTRYTR